jgi:hypothetical protein
LFQTFFETLGAYVVGTVISAIALGFLIDKFIIKKVMGNKDVKRLLDLLPRIEDKLDRILEEKNHAP